MPNKTGNYIVIEGTDGAGTTTQKEMLKAALEARGQEVIEIAEPGGTPIGEALRAIIKDGSMERSPQSNLDMFTACRRELAEQVITPALERGVSVISDRNWFSTIAYQGFGEKVDVNAIVTRSEDALGKLLVPHIAVVVDVPVEVSEQRISHRGADANDTFESKGREFFQRVREGYLWVASEYELPVVDGTQSKEAVHAEILAIVDRAE